jgi:hypothetical protein
MNKYLFIPPFSNHAPHIHKGWVTSYIKRLQLNCTCDIDFILNKHTFFIRLFVRGYDADFLLPIFTKPIRCRQIIKTLLQNKNNWIHNKLKTPKMIFKLPTCNRTCHLKEKIKKRLQYRKQIRQIRNHKEVLGKDTTAPILFFKGGKILGSILVTATLQKNTNKDT